MFKKKSNRLKTDVYYETTETVQCVGHYSLHIRAHHGYFIGHFFLTSRLNYIGIDIFVNCNWVDTQWQQYSIHLHTNSTQNNTINNFGRKGFWDSNPEWSN